jgi:hypothetical protein
MKNTRLFHAIVVAGCALGGFTACGPMEQDPTSPTFGDRSGAESFHSGNTYPTDTTVLGGGHHNGGVPPDGGFPDGGDGGWQTTK